MGGYGMFPEGEADLGRQQHSLLTGMDGRENVKCDARVPHGNFGNQRFVSDSLRTGSNSDLSHISGEDFQRPHVRARDNAVG